MEKEIRIKSNIKEYKVFFENNMDFIKNFNEVEYAQFVIDKNVYELYETVFINIPKDRLVIIEAIETNKTIDLALQVCEKITELPAKRNATLISIGGGIIQDITGFVANIMYRGINWIFVPTTLLAACDSCIGGKTSLNYKNFKNLLGTFYPPNEVYICSKWFETLTEKDYKSGLGEVIKFNIMEGLQSLCKIEENINGLLSRDIEVVNKFVLKSLDYKKSFIEIDEFDKGERIKLNFAHTFGHAIEVVSKFEIPHGTAVAIGMIMADAVSFKRSYITEQWRKRSEALLLKVIEIDISLLEMPLEDFLNAMKKDKKQIADMLTVVLLKQEQNENELRIVHDITVNEVDDAIAYFVDLYKKEK